MSKPGTSMEIPHHNWDQYPRVRSRPRFGSHRGRITRPIWTPTASVDYRSISKQDFKGNTIGKNVRKQARAKSAPGYIRKDIQARANLAPGYIRNDSLISRHKFFPRAHEFIQEAENFVDNQDFFVGEVNGKLKSGDIYHIFDAFVKSQNKVHKDNNLKDSSIPLNKDCTCPPGYHKASCRNVDGNQIKMNGQIPIEDLKILEQKIDSHRKHMDVNLNQLSKNCIWELSSINEQIATLGKISDIQTKTMPDYVSELSNLKDKSDCILEDSSLINTRIDSMSIAIENCNQEIKTCLNDLILLDEVQSEKTSTVVEKIDSVMKSGDFNLAFLLSELEKSNERLNSLESKFSKKQGIFAENISHLIKNNTTLDWQNLEKIHETVIVINNPLTDDSVSFQRNDKESIGTSDIPIFASIRAILGHHCNRLTRKKAKMKTVLGGFFGLCIPFLLLMLTMNLPMADALSNEYAESIKIDGYNFDPANIKNFDYIAGAQESVFDSSNDHVGDSRNMTPVAFITTVILSMIGLVQKTKPKIILIMILGLFVNSPYIKAKDHSFVRN